MRLAVIGDSLAQGFQDGAIGPQHPLRSFPALIAESLGLRVGVGAGHDFRVPEIPGDGLPLDIVRLLERVQKATGNEISAWEWPAKVVPIIGHYFKQLEDYYEQGAGSRPLAFSGVYHNLAAHGFTVADSGQLSAERCTEVIREQEGWFRDDLFGTPSGAKYRAARLVLDPAANRPQATQLDNLELLIRGDARLGIAPEPIDVLILWLGANDCLATVVELELRDMAKDAHPDLSLSGRRGYNLTSAEVFRKDYEALASRLDHILEGCNTQVFVGTVPDVSIPPIAKGLGQVERDVFPYYVRFFVDGDLDRPPPFHKFLTAREVAAVQARIAAFNRHIRAVVGARPSWHLVDMANVLDQLAVRRNRKQPPEPLQDYYRQKGRPDHPLLQLEPVPSLLTLRTQDQRRIGGGLTSLDGVHPTTIGYGIAAEAFLEVMQQHGVPGADPRKLDWPRISRQDRVINRHDALAVWDDFVSTAEAHSLVWDIAFRSLGSRI